MDAQSQALGELIVLAEAGGISIWFYGGYGLDALVGRALRAHKDIDILLWRHDVPRLVAALLSGGFSVQEEQGHSVGLIRAEQWLECLTFQVIDGMLVTDTGDTGVFPWPDDAFPEHPNGVLLGKPVRAVSWGAQYVLKAGHQAYDPQQTLRPKDIKDLELIHEHVPPEAREQLARLFDALPGTRRHYPGSAEKTG